MVAASSCASHRPSATNSNEPTTSKASLVLLSGMVFSATGMAFPGLGRGGRRYRHGRAKPPAGGSGSRESACRVGQFALGAGEGVENAAVRCVRPRVVARVVAGHPSLQVFQHAVLVFFRPVLVRFPWPLPVGCQ